MRDLSLIYLVLEKSGGARPWKAGMQRYCRGIAERMQRGYRGSSPSISERKTIRGNQEGGREVDAEVEAVAHLV